MSVREDIEYAISGKTPSRKGWVRVCCPACESRQGTPDRKFSLGVHVPTGRWHCFRCASRGRCSGDGFDVEVEEAEPEPAIEPPEAFFELYDGAGASSASLENARRYVRRRGITDAAAKEMRIGACTSGRFYGRVVVPVFDATGRWVWHVGRDIAGKAERRYLYPTGDRVGVMFNIGALDIETDEPVLCGEGCFDAAPHWPHASAFLGKPTEAHFERLLDARRPICIMLDGDAWEEGEALSWRLRIEGKRAGFIRFPPCTDPNEFTTESLLDEARNSLDA